MKAKDCAKMYIESPDKKKAIAVIASAFLEEIKTIAESRNAKKASALIPIYREQNQKWRKFASIVNNQNDELIIEYDGFENLVKRFAPDLHELVFASHLLKRF